MPPRLPRLTPIRRLSLSNLAAQFSEQVALAAAPLVAVIALGADAAATGWLQTMQTLPFLLLSIPFGILADRLSRRAMIVGAELVRALSLVAVLGLALTGGLTLNGLALLGFIGAIGTVCYTVAVPALVPGLVAAGDLAAANRAQELGRSIAYAAGPAAGGLLVALAGGSAAFAIAVALSLLAAAMLARLPEPPAAARIRRHPVAELAEGLVFVARHPSLRATLLTAVVFNTAWFILQAVFVAYAARDLGLGPAAIGLALGGYGAGMVAGALFMPRLSRHLRFGAMLVIGPLAALVASGLMLATLVVPSVALVVASFVLFGAGPIIWSIATVTLRQAVTPPAMLGRVSALVMTATFGARPIGAAIGAWLALHHGVGAALGASAIGFALQFAIIVCARASRLAALPSLAART